MNKDIEVMDIEISESKYKDLKSKCECLKMQINLGGNKRVVFTGATMLVQAAKQVDGSMLPFTTKIIEEDGYYRFT